MKIIDTTRQRVHALLTAPGEELGRWARFVRYQIHLWRFCARRLREHNAMAMSSALSFRTIFALVPALVLSLLVMKSLGMVDEGKESLRRFLAEGGFERIARVSRPPGAGAASAPATQPAMITAADEIERLVSRVEGQLTFGTVGPVGVVLLIWSALALLMTMEGALNRVFGAARKRALGRRVPLYWSVVTLGPIVLAATAYAGGQAAASFRDTPGLSWALAGANWAGPVVVGIVLLAGLYKLMPNTHVRFRAAIGGAVVAVPLWLVAKWAFGLYVTELVLDRPSLYGALGMLPLFLLWLNLSWTIFLFGAELASTAANLERMQSAELAERIMLGPSDLLAAALCVARPYLRGNGAVGFERITAALALPPESVQRLLDRLTAAGIVLQAGTDPAGGYVLARPAETVRVAEIMEIAPRAEGPAARAAYQDDIAEVVARVTDRTRGALGSVTLADIMSPQLTP